MNETPADLVTYEGDSKFIRVRDRRAYRDQMNGLLEFVPGATTVVTVDMQRDYLDLDVGSCPATPLEAARVIAGAERLLGLARAHGVPVIHSYVMKTQHEFEAGVYGNPYSRMSTEHKLSQNVWKGVREIPDRLVGTPQAEVYPTLVADSDLRVDTKRTNDACFQTHLPLLLERVTHAKTVLLIGVNTDSCVYATAFTLANLGYQVVVVEDAVASTRGVDHHLLALELMQRSFCWVMSADEVEKKLAQVTSLDA